MMKVIARQLRLVTLITVGWGLQAQAQPTDFSLPPLPNMATVNSSGQTGSMPPLPSTPIAPNAGVKSDTITPSEVADQPAPLAIPELANLPTPAAPTTTGAADPATPMPDVATATGATDATATTSPTTPPTDTAKVTPAPIPPIINEEADAVAGEGTGGNAGTGTPTLNVAGPPTTLPGLGNFPVAPPPGSTNALPPQSSQPATMLGEVDVEAPPPAPKNRTWKTKLAPVQQASTRGFNYRRQVLPDAIYRKSYDRENQHLPIQVTRNDYSRLLIERVAANDINGTRALLNEGLSVNTTDSSGQTLLSVARRSGARDTERLLIARGAS